MLILLVPLVVALIAYVYWRNRDSTLTRHCRWRANRAAGPGHFNCVACGGEMRTSDGEPPRECVARPPQGSPRNDR
jgi:hypothetical protein